MECRKCGAEMDMVEKDTSSGRDIREHLCRKCGFSDWEVRGKALWQILSDDKEELELEAAKARVAAQAVAEVSGAESRCSWWQRLLGRLGGARKP